MKERGTLGTVLLFCMLSCVSGSSVTFTKGESIGIAVSVIFFLCSLAICLYTHHLQQVLDVYETIAVGLGFKEKVPRRSLLVRLLFILVYFKFNSNAQRLENTSIRRRFG
jgi:hypothetical protein